MSVIKQNLLVVDDDLRLRKLLQKFLQKNNYNVLTAASTSLAENILNTEQVDLIVLDVMMPGETGLAFCRRIRDNHALPYSQIPILMLTARGAVDDRIQGLESGADDYLGKPFESRELILRIDNILKRRRANQPEFQQPQSNVVGFGSYIYDVAQQVLTNNGDIIHLTSVEQDLMQVFSHHLRVPLSREDLAEKCGVTLSARTIDVQITRLRKKIEADPKEPLYLRTIRHKGYALWNDQ